MRRLGVKKNKLLFVTPFVEPLQKAHSKHFLFTNTHTLPEHSHTQWPQYHRLKTGSNVRHSTSKKTLPKPKQNSPGPSTYNINVNRLSSHKSPPSVTFTPASVQRFQQPSTKKESPGPGQYLRKCSSLYASSKYKSSVCFSMCRGRQQQQPWDLPGPGSYFQERSEGDRRRLYIEYKNIHE